MSARHEFSAPTIFHITHWKAGSQWVNNVLKDYCKGIGVNRFMAPMMKARHLYDRPIQSGGIYAKSYIPYYGFNALMEFDFFSGTGLNHVWKNKINLFHMIANRQRFNQAGERYKVVVTIRDLRDALVSWYFSMKTSHAVLDVDIAERHERLNLLSKEEGLIYLIQDGLQSFADIQCSWQDVDVYHVSYEELVEGEYEVFHKIITYCELPMDEAVLANVVQRNSFEMKTGRVKGEVDEAAHLRVGVVGDWESHFTPRVKEEFKLRFGQVLIDTGYEESMDW